MTDKLNEIFHEVAEETFESLAFMLMMPEDENDNPSPDDQKVLIDVGFHGPFSGRVFLTLEQKMLPEIASNMLGLDFDEVPLQDQQLDAAKELLNVVCGNLLPKIAGTEAVFNVDAPQLTEHTQIPQEVENLDKAASTHLLLDGGWAQLSLFVDKEAAQIISVSA